MHVRGGDAEGSEGSVVVVEVEKPEPRDSSEEGFKVEG